MKEVASAVPAFIGHTQKADNNGAPLSGKPWRITSLAEFERHFGAAPEPGFDLSTATSADSGELLTVAGKNYYPTQATAPYLLYYSLQLFYRNGGDACYIVSVGNYTEPLESARFKQGIELLTKEREPTIVVVPEAANLKAEDCIDVQQAALRHCGLTMKNRVAILDVPGGYKSRHGPAGDPVQVFRDKLGSECLGYGAAYYPWLDTTITGASALSYENVAPRSRPLLVSLLEEESGIADADAAKLTQRQQEQKSEIANIVKDRTADGAAKSRLHQSLLVMSPAYNRLLACMAAKLNRLPPSAAMAGVYTRADVWTAPANVSLDAVISPAVSISHGEQEDLNVPLDGKSINAIRSFAGKGVLPWGARTLDGNNPDWRYIAVRRTAIMIEESIRRAFDAHGSAPNDGSTWFAVRDAIRDFLNGLWRRGGLGGSTPNEAYAVLVGLGETMTGMDMLDGLMRVTVRVALVRPAEFIEIGFTQQMQKC